MGTSSPAGGCRHRHGRQSAQQDAAAIAQKFSKEPGGAAHIIEIGDWRGDRQRRRASKAMRSSWLERPRNRRSSATAFAFLRS
jgi:hypothetical protein